MLFGTEKAFEDAVNAFFEPPADQVKLQAELGHHRRRGCRGRGREPGCWPAYRVGEGGPTTVQRGQMWAVAVMMTGGEGRPTVSVLWTEHGRKQSKEVHVG